MATTLPKFHHTRYKGAGTRPKETEGTTMQQTETMSTPTTPTKALRLLTALLLSLVAAAAITLAAPTQASADEPASGWNVGYTAPGSGVVATIVVADDATTVTKAMVKSSQWSTDGESWSTESLVAEPGNTYYLFTPLSGMGSSSTAVLPNIKADVTVDVDPAITDAGNFFMYCYAGECTLLTSLGAPEVSGLTTAGYMFFAFYAGADTALTSLGVPDTSNMTTVGTQFLAYYASGCTSLTSLDVPNTSNITSTEDQFMAQYAAGCTSLTALAAPETSNIISVWPQFMYGYAQNCTSLETLAIPTLNSSRSGMLQNYAANDTALNTLVMNSGPGIFATTNTNWGVPAAAATDEAGLVALVPAEYLDDWRALTAAGKTLALNQITFARNVIAEGVEPLAPHAITVGELNGGTIAASSEQAYAYDEVTLTITENPGYMYVSGSIAVGGESGDVAVSGWELTYTFTMPDEPVNVTASFGQIIPGTTPGVTATIVVANDATATTKPMVNYSQWSADGVVWSGDDLTPEPGSTYYVYTPLAGMSSSTTAVLPDVKADVTISIDSSIMEAGDYFLYAYAYNCSRLTSIEFSGTTHLETVGNYFMRYFARNCTSLTSLGVPDTSNITTAGIYFMAAYAQSDTALKTLSIPDTTALTSAGGLGFMASFAATTNSLDTLVMNSAPGWFVANNVNWGVPAAAATDEEGLVAVVPTDSLAEWQALTATGYTLATNQITEPVNVITAATPGLGPNSGDFDGDGVVTAADAIAAARAVVSGAGSLSAEQLAAADIDNDGKLTMADVVKIVRLAVGL
jgi:hypothetical protein